uniref:Uncharacterized protein n=1 Tax=Coccolithus braarudii TaxID=221442 RepID=A0A7S0QAT2_9EUKA
MVLNASLAHKAFGTSAMFARKVDPGLYVDALYAWDRWMASKLITGRAASGQPAIAQNLIDNDPLLNKGLPPKSAFEDGGAAKALHLRAAMSRMPVSTAPASSLSSGPRRNTTLGDELPGHWTDTLAADRGGHVEPSGSLAVSMFISIWMVLVFAGSIAFGGMLLWRSLSRTLSEFSPGVSWWRSVEKQALHSTKVV